MPVFHLDLMAPEFATNVDARGSTSITSNYLRPIDKDGDVWLYEIVGWPR